MRMTLYDFATSICCYLIKSIRELTKTSADGGDHAPFLKHAARHKALCRRGPADLLPKGEDRASGDHAKMQTRGRDTEVLDLSTLVPNF